MATSCGVSVLDICRVRGDTGPFQFVVKDSSGTPIDITGFSFLLTVDPNDIPIDASGNLFDLTGTIIDGPNGVFQFTLDATDADQTPAIYFYDVQMTDLASNKRTIIRGQWEVTQDITK